MAFETSTVTFGGNDAQQKANVPISYSKIKNFRSCPKRHFHYDIAKDVKEERSEALDYGDAVHLAMQNRISKGTPLPAQFADYEPIVKRFLVGADKPGARVFVEQKYAIDKNFQPCSFFNNKIVFYRAIADALKIIGPVALNNDWKTGKVKDDPLQILTAAACIFAHYPEVQIIRNEYVWLESVPIKITTVDLRRDQLPQLWADVMPEFEMYAEAVRTGTFPPKKNGLCGSYCNITSCQFHGG
jgi:hypothetical protein